MPLDTKRRWFAFIESPARAMRVVNLIQFNEWLQEESQIHERLLSSDLTISQLDTPSSKCGKRFDFKKNPQSGESALCSNTDKDRLDSKCPLCNAKHRIWNCEKFKNMKTQDRYDVAKEKRLCFACFSDNHAAKESPRTTKCGIDNCEKTHNKLLQYRKKSEVSSVSVKSESTNLIRNSESARVLMKVARVRIFGQDGQFDDTLAACDTNPTQTWADEDLLDRLQLDGETISLNVTGIHGTQSTSCQAVQVTIGPANSPKSKGKQLTVNNQKNLKIGRSVYIAQEMKLKYPYLNCVAFNEIDLKVTIILGQNAYELIRPLEYKSGGENKPWAVKLPLSWTVSGTLPVKEIHSRVAACHDANKDDI